MPPESVRVLGVPVDNVTERDVLAYVDDTVSARVSRHLVTVNAEYVMLAQRNPSFRAAILDADLRTPDSAGILMAARRRGVRIPARVGGSDLIWSISAQAAERKQSIFLLGAGPGVAAATAKRLVERSPGLLVAGTHEGGPNQTWDDEQVEMITAAKPDILFVAFGSPAQDIWIARLKGRLNVPVCIGVGGSFDYVAGIATRAPVWMRQFGLDWLYRLIRQPWRWRRMLVLPKFAMLALARSD